MPRVNPMKARRRLFLAVFGLCVLYSGLQAIRLFPARPMAAWLGTIVFLLAAINAQFAFRSRDGGAWARRAAWAGGAAMGWWAAFVLLSLLLESAFFVPAKERVLAAMIAAVAVSAAGLAQALAGPVLEEKTVPIEGLAAGLRGLRLVQISDLHVGPTIRRDYVEAVVARVLALKPDLIAVTGDLVDGRPENLSEQVEPLRALKAPLGVYYVTGNHEYYWGALPWIEKVRELGMTPLVDEGRVVERGGEKLLVAGVCDAQASWFVPAHKSDPARAAQDGGGCSLKILLAHRPESCVEAEKAGFDLQLSGHTHGGQFFPFKLLLPLVERFRSGLYRRGRLRLYVSRGTGYWGPPNRFGVPAEISLLTLAAAQDGQGQVDVGKSEQRAGTAEMHNGSSEVGRGKTEERAGAADKARAARLRAQGNTRAANALDRRGNAMERQGNRQVIQGRGKQVQGKRVQNVGTRNVIRGRTREARH